MNATIAKLVKLLKGMDEGYPNSVTQAMRREFRDAIRPLYGDDYMLETIQYEVERQDNIVSILEEGPGDNDVLEARRTMKYLRRIHEKLDEKWREINNIIVGHCGTPCNMGCPECAPGGYDHAGEF